MKKFKSVFISDIHLGTRGCKAELLLKFLKDIECENLFLVGDIFDGWRLKSSWYWNQDHSTVVQKLLRLSRKGTKVYYIPGNHDEFMRGFLEHSFGNIELHNEMTYQSVDGRKFIVVHGDKFDLVTMNIKWLAKVGDVGYTTLLNINTGIHFIRSILRLPYWSLSKWAKRKVKEAVNFIGNYQDALVQYAKINKVDGIICGHIHSATITKYGSIQYINCGDWVESCTAVVEHLDGRFELLEFA